MRCLNPALDTTNTEADPVSHTRRLTRCTYWGGKQDYLQEGSLCFTLSYSTLFVLWKSPHHWLPLRRSPLLHIIQGLDPPSVAFNTVSVLKYRSRIRFRASLWSVSGEQSILRVCCLKQNWPPDSNSCSCHQVVKEQSHCERKKHKEIQNQKKKVIPEKLLEAQTVPETPRSQ